MVYEEPMSGRVQCSPECGVSQVPERGRDSAKRGYAVARQKEIDHHEQKNRSMPSLHSDEAVEDFVATADLARYDLSGFKPMRFEIEPKAATLNMRLPASLLDAVKARAKAKGIPYTRYVRMLLETDVAQAR